MGKKSEYLLDSGYTLNMFEIQKYCNKIFQKEYFHSKIHCLTLHLPCTSRIANDIIFRFVSAFKLVYLSDLLGFKNAYFCK